MVCVVTTPLYSYIRVPQTTARGRNHLTCEAISPDRKTPFVNNEK